MVSSETAHAIGDIRDAKAAGVPDSALVESRRRLVRLALDDGHLETAFDTLRDLNDHTGIADLGEYALERDLWYDAMRCFKHLGDRDGFRTIIERTQHSHVDRGACEAAADGYIAVSKPNFLEAMGEWAERNAREDAKVTYFWPTMTMAHALADSYDLGVANSHGGLGIGFAFHMFGTDVRVVRSRGIGSEGTYAVLTPVQPEDIAGRRIAVFDNDVWRGRRSERILYEVNRHNPESVDLVLGLGPRSTVGGIGFVEDAVPEGYANVHHPEGFSYDGMTDVIAALEAAFPK